MFTEGLNTKVKLYFVYWRFKYKRKFKLNLMKLQNMKVSVRSNLLVNIILSFFYIELCYCIILDRESTDKIDSLNPYNCDGISNALHLNGRCKCSFPSSILSTNTGEFTCIKDQFVDGGKYAWGYIHYRVPFYQINLIMLFV